MMTNGLVAVELAYEGILGSDWKKLKKQRNSRNQQFIDQTYNI